MSFVSGELFTGLCDVAVYERWYLNTYENIGRHCKEIIIINDGIGPREKDLIEKSFSFFVKTDYILYFKAYILPFIKKKFILITHNAAEIVGKDSEIIENPYLLKWFGQNMTPNEKGVGLPLGLENYDHNHHNNELINKYKDNKKENLLYINFSLHTNPKRKQIMENIKQRFPVNEKKNWDGYIEDLSTYKYCLSPPGFGPDCHRIWECMYVNCIPIVKRDPILFTHFRDLPILWVDDFDVITEDFLEKCYPAFSNKNTAKSTLQYWEKLFQTLKHQHS
tara:strand:+ start:1988 stop:2824 length:837 start_codon:yes stop_codon:yes gene_type:complete